MIRVLRAVSYVMDRKRQGMYYKKTVIAMLVQKKHAGVKRDCDLISLRPAIPWIKHCLAPNTPLGSRCKVE
jgi:hypothetical protein